MAEAICATGVGSMPGTDFPEAARTVLDLLSDLPFLPELPARGVPAEMTGRTLGVVPELGVDLQPAGWRLTGGAASTSGVDHRRAASLLAQDLDVWEELTEDYAGPLKVQLAGPWTLAATVEVPRGEKVLADRGARRELAQALALGIAAHVGDVRRRVPGAALVVQVDEPLLPAVLSGAVPTASGLHRHRVVDLPEAAGVLGEVLGAAGVPTVVHCCAAGPPLDLMRTAGADAVSVDLSMLTPGDLDALGGLLDEGAGVHLGVVPSAGQAPPSVRSVTESVLRLLDMLGLDPNQVRRGPVHGLVLTASCGLAGATQAYARDALETLGRTAREL